MNDEMLTLIPGTYAFPEDCDSYIHEGKIYVVKRAPKPQPDPVLRCRHCKFFAIGKHSFNQYREAYVCYKKRKPQGGNSYKPIIRKQIRYYAANGCARACDLFEPKQDTK